MRKICVVITARASYSRIKAALLELKNNPDVELQLVVAASAMLNRYGSAYKQIEADGFVINDKVYSILEGENGITQVKTTGVGMMELASIFDRNKPDAVVTIADRYETIATAIAAAYMNIPLIHIQGGEITGNIDEKVRHAITKLADVHLAASRQAADRIIRMGEDPDYVYVTGCPSIDLAAEAMRNPVLDFDPIERYGGSGEKPFEPKDYYVVIQHPVTDEAEHSYEQAMETLNAMYELGKNVYWIWPNPDSGSDGTSKAIRIFREHKKPQNIWFFRDIPSKDFLRILLNSNGIVGNSSVGIRECSFLGVPAVNIGSRQSKRDRAANVVDVAPNKEAILAGIEKAGQFNRESSTLYGDGCSGKKIADLIATVPLRYSKRLNY